MISRRIQKFRRLQERCPIVCFKESTFSQPNYMVGVEEQCMCQLAYSQCNSQDGVFNMHAV
ncbi:hypothetical protein HW555_000230 [Spodoptera exigua]|uniref:Uncharacterized protein n=1 Tax=Spodoptera exigua TaxID=7107 RepID=A0A835LCH5_SPOEX|nr:hypothetical protein HW555_000230 [Spodoptera exigua]